MYTKALTALLSEGAITLGDSIVVFCGGTVDVDALRALGFSDVTITNLDERYEGCAPYQWSLQNAERTTYADRSFDWAFVHAGLHHCESPHRALLEMLRVTRKGVLVIEARDSALMRVANKLNLSPEFEIHAVINEKRLLGGVSNGPVPNYIYRWTEREVQKLVESRYPERANAFRYFYGMRQPLFCGYTGAKRAAALTIWQAARVFQAVFPRQGNTFAFAVLHSDKVKPWMTADGKMVREDWHL
jgi:SAM-dependent methyltransferase